MKPFKILIVEDNEGDVEMTQRALSTAQPPCSLTIAHDGLQALDLLRHEPGTPAPPIPQLILLDINMPRMDGKELLAAVKADDRLRHIPVVMFTSSESPTDIRECYERHASCYVVKPFNGRKYAEALHDVVTFWSTTSRLPN
ncbi:response regulator [Novosphingobium aerophilum]|uniref:response regulator n=1 Tax=Novosphingobium TaxID=165696 RepID=UPI001048719D|nr:MULTISPECIES: response regulator [unclassified Novosphingobium]MPS69642.1 response regulator [Novosphingobium sp.]TCM33033.1 CheY-like chemotaxis protein [Novosphingobium sp. ST904]WRT94903.1 response regulator [Novosphingobium sp. RL4]